jgi:precorrin-3B methylase
MTEALAAMRAENARLQAQLNQKEQSGIIKISPKGGVSVYGMGQFPVTLYRTQWERLFKIIPDVQAFIQANASKLAEKPAKAKA